MHKTLAILFCLSCYATAYMSNSLLGAGMWFYIIVFTGSFVAASQFIQKLRAAGVVFAVLLSVVSLLSVALGLVASTVGSSSKNDTETHLLLAFFALIAIFGFSLSRAHKRLGEQTTENSISTTDE